MQLQLPLTTPILNLYASGIHTEWKAGIPVPLRHPQKSWPAVVSRRLSTHRDRHDQFYRALEGFRLSLALNECLWRCPFGDQTSLLLLHTVSRWPSLSRRGRSGNRTHQPSTPDLRPIWCSYHRASGHSKFLSETEKRAGMESNHHLLLRGLSLYGLATV